MASTFKTLLNDDVVSTRTLLHEAIPITGTIMSGTYSTNNIKTFTHGMFESTFDYPYLSSSANQLVDISYGHHHSISSSLGAAGYQVQKKRDIYQQFAQVLLGYDQDNNIMAFDSDGTLDGGASTANGKGGRMDHCFFLSYSRLLVKDEIKKGSYTLSIKPFGSLNAADSEKPSVTTEVVLGDYAAGSEYFTSPAGDYGLIFETDAEKSDPENSIGLIFYQAGVVVLSSSIFHDPTGFGIDNAGVTVGALTFGYSGSEGNAVNWGDESATGEGTAVNADGVLHAQASGSIENMAQGLRNRWVDCNFNNTIELNSTIYFARINHNEFNYSANPTYVSSGKLVVKNNVTDLPVTYLTSVGLYSPDNELLAVAKLSEPIRKDPNTELTLRVRLDY